jgi:hypothetical protein
LDQLRAVIRVVAVASVVILLVFTLGASMPYGVKLGIVLLSSTSLSLWLLVAYLRSRRPN